MEESLASPTYVITAPELDALYGYATAFLAVLGESPKTRALALAIEVIGGVSPSYVEKVADKLEPTIHANIAAGLAKSR
jgi:hypothetical protein